MSILLRWVALAALAAQSSEAPDWQAAAGGKLSFDVAAVKPSTTFRVPNFPLNAGNAKTPGGRLSAVFPLSIYISFAYKLQQTQAKDAFAQAPQWVTTDRYDIEARVEGNPTKDQMRLMMQSLLTERCKLAVHYETREVPVFALTLVKSGNTGPKLHPHSEGPPCPEFTQPAAGSISSDTFPPNCDTDVMRGSNGTRMIGYRNATTPLLATMIYFYGAMAGEVDRPVVDQTGLHGNFDFTIEYAPGEMDRFARPRTPSPDARPPDPQGAAFLHAVREQLGLKLVPSKAPIRMLVIDHIERPSEN
jgi:bla regulator protein BlaR1